MEAKKLQAEITQLDIDPESLLREGGQEGRTSRMPNIRIIIVGDGGNCKKYITPDGSEILYVCGP